MNKKYLVLMLLAGVNTLSLKAADVSLGENEQKKWEDMLEKVKKIDEKNKPIKRRLLSQFREGSISEADFELAYNNLSADRYDVMEYIRLSNHTDQPISMKDSVRNMMIGTLQPHESKLIKSTTGGSSIDLFAQNQNQINWDKKGKGMHFHINKKDGRFSVERENPFNKKK